MVNSISLPKALNILFRKLIEGLNKPFYPKVKLFIKERTSLIKSCLSS